MGESRTAARGGMRNSDRWCSLMHVTPNVCNRPRIQVHAASTALATSPPAQVTHCSKQGRIGNFSRVASYNALRFQKALTNCNCKALLIIPDKATHMPFYDFPFTLDHARNLPAHLLTSDTCEVLRDAPRVPLDVSNTACGA